MQRGGRVREKLRPDYEGIETIIPALVAVLGTARRETKTRLRGD